MLSGTSLTACAGRPGSQKPIAGERPWRVVEDADRLVPSEVRERAGGDERVGHEQVQEEDRGGAWRFRTGSPWRDLPAQLGRWRTLWKRHRRWSTDGTYQEIFELQEGWSAPGLTGADQAGDIDGAAKAHPPAEPADTHIAAASSVQRLDVPAVENY